MGYLGQCKAKVLGHELRAKRQSVNSIPMALPDRFSSRRIDRWIENAFIEQEPDRLVARQPAKQDSPL